MNASILEQPSIELQLQSLTTLVEQLQQEVCDLRRENGELRRQVRQLRCDVGYWKSRHAGAVERNTKINAELEAAQAEIRQLKAERFGKQSEKQSTSDRSNDLEDPRLPPVAKKKRGQQPNRPAPKRRDYSHLPARESLIDLPEEAKPRGGNDHRRAEANRAAACADLRCNSASPCAVEVLSCGRDSREGFRGKGGTNRASLVVVAVRGRGLRRLCARSEPQSQRTAIRLWRRRARRVDGRSLHCLQSNAASERLRHSVGTSEFTAADVKLRQHIAAMAKQRDRELADGKLRDPCRKALVSWKEHSSGLTLFVDDPRIPLDNNHGKWLNWYFDACVACDGKVPNNPASFLPWNLTEDRLAELQDSASGVASLDTS